MRGFFIAIVLFASSVQAQDETVDLGRQSFPQTPAVKGIYTLEEPSDLRGWYRNPDGSCVQCSIGMVGMNLVGSTYYSKGAWSAATLLWDTDYGAKVRGGSNPSRVESYSARRGIPIYNVTGEGTFDWMKWAAKTGRFAAIGAGGSHFQTLYGYNPKTDVWYVCNNNSTSKVDEYSMDEFRSLHLASGRWIVVLDLPPAPVVPQYIPWWQ